MNLPAEQLQSNKTLTLVLYILYIAAIFSAGLLAIIAPVSYTHLTLPTKA